MASWEDMPIKGGKAQVFDIPLNTISANAPAEPRTVEKKPFLRRNTGLQKRLEMSREKKYVPRGGFLTEAHDNSDMPPLNSRSGTATHGARGRGKAPGAAAAKLGMRRGPSPPARRPATGAAAAAARPMAAKGRVAPAAAPARAPARPAVGVRAAAPERPAVARAPAKASRPAAQRGGWDAQPAAHGYSDEHWADARDETGVQNYSLDEQPVRARAGTVAAAGGGQPAADDTDQDGNNLSDFERLEQQAARDSAVQRLATVNRSRASSRRSSAASWAGDSGLPQLPNGFGRHDAAAAQQQPPPARALANGYVHNAAADPRPEEGTRPGAHPHDGTAEHSNMADLGVPTHGDEQHDKHAAGAAAGRHGPSGFTGPYSDGRRTAASTLEQLAAPSPAQDSAVRPDRHTNDYSHTNGFGHSSGYNQANGYGPTHGKPSHQRWPEHEDEGAEDYVAATLDRVHRLAPVAAPAGVKTRPGLRKPSGAPEPDPEKEALREEVARLRGERARVKGLKAQLERSMAALSDQRAAFLKQQDEEQAKWEAEKAAQAARLRRDKLTLEKQSRALLKLPTKKERSEIEALEALLDHERGEGRAREQRHKLTVERLRRQIADLQEKQAALKEELAWHVEQRARDRTGAALAALDSAPADPPQRGRTDANPSERPPDKIADGWRAAFQDAAASRGEPLANGHAHGAPSWHSSARGPAGGRATRGDAASANPLYDDSGAHGLFSYNANGCGSPERPAGGAQPPPGSYQPASAQRGDRRWGNSGAAGRDGSRPASPQRDDRGETRAGVGARTARFDVAEPSHAGGGLDCGWQNGSTAHLRQGAGWQGDAGVQQDAETRWPGAVPAGTPPRRASDGFQHPDNNFQHPDDGFQQPYEAAQPDSRRDPQQRGADADFTDTVHMDGKRERHFRDGRRMVVFVNGTIKEEYPSGLSIVRFTNGDIKKAYKNGLVEYLYAEVDTWHTTCTDGTQVFYFASGQAEAHRPDGSKEVLFPDGTGRTVSPEGVESDVPAEALCSAVRAPAPADVPAIVL